MITRIDPTLMILLFGCCLLGVTLSGKASADAVPTDAGWKAGVARVDITPAEPLWLAGYAGRDRAAENTLHPIWAKAIALEDQGGNRAVLVTADILGFPKAMSDRIRDRIEADHGLGRAQIILSASHTHSAPVIDDSLLCIYPIDGAELARILAYAHRLEDMILALVGDAVDNLAPAALFAGNGVARFAVNRRNNSERDLTPIMTPVGPSDHAAPTLTIKRADGEIAAVVFGYACHATVLDGYAWNGDYPGFAQLAVEERFPGATALFFAGCGADQNPLPRRSVALARQYGQTLAAAVIRAVEDRSRPLDARLAVAYEEVMLELESAPDADTYRARAASSGGYEQRCNQGMLDRLESGETLPAAWPVPVQVWRLGDQTLVAIGGEVTVEYSIGVKERLGDETFVMGYANDVMSYLPSERILEEGGYEGHSSQLIYGMPNVWKPGLEKRILDAVEALHGDVR